MEDHEPDRCADECDLGLVVSPAVLFFVKANRPVPDTSDRRGQGCSREPIDHRFATIERRRSEDKYDAHEHVDELADGHYSLLKT